MSSKFDSDETKKGRNVMRRLVIFLTVAVISSFIPTISVAAASFFEGKTIRVTVGASAGGGYDLWARTVGRHIGKYIPGNPVVIVENVTGAGGLIMANQLFKGTKPDGLTIGHVNGGLILSQMLGQPGYDFDPQKFIYIGAVNKENAVLVFGKKSGISSADKWRSAPSAAKLGGLVPGNMADNISRMGNVLAFPTQIVTGYKGTADILIAIESGELAGGPASWDSMKVNRKRQMDSGDMFVVVQAAAKPLKGIPNVPTIFSLAKTEEQKKTIQLVINDANEYSRPFALPPGTPKERVGILRKAFHDMQGDKEFLAEVDRMQMTLDPTTADEMAAGVARFAGVDQTMKAKLKEILFK
jgi:tripartite-type tricarboxylate transporter receptor subunit TctC